MSRRLKVHAFCPEPERHMPIVTSRDYYARGLRGTKCGYMRQVAQDDSGVTCKNCLRELAKAKAKGQPC